ncbi:MAG TPA: hypothetical protein VJ935_12885 [Acidimicrobiia bacterium]|nr:hypothetical protein [Acidimicrobiia bacterium]
MTDDLSAATGLLEKIRQFVAELSQDERSLFAVLIGPGVALAYENDVEVEGFSLSNWSPRQLPASLAAAIREQNVRVTGLVR